MNQKLILIATLFSTSLLASLSCFAADFSEPTPELLENGKKAYAANCLTCHGATGDGNGPASQYLDPKPRNLAADVLKNGDKPEQILASITKGVPGTAMVAFAHLPEEVRWALTHYILSLRKK